MASILLGGIKQKPKPTWLDETTRHKQRYETLVRSNRITVIEHAVHEVLCRVGIEPKFSCLVAQYTDQVEGVESLVAGCTQLLPGAHSLRVVSLEGVKELLSTDALSSLNDPYSSRCSSLYFSREDEAFKKYVRERNRGFFMRTAVAVGRIGISAAHWVGQQVDSIPEVVAYKKRKVVVKAIEDRGDFVPAELLRQKEKQDDILIDSALAKLEKLMPTPSHQPPNPYIVIPRTAIAFIAGIARFIRS